MSNIDQYLVSLDRFNQINEIDRGMFSIIKLIEKIDTHERYAAKIIYNQDPNDEIYKPHIEYLIQLNHPTIINFIGFSRTDFSGNNNYTLIFEYTSNKSLVNFLDTNNLDNTDRQIILSGISRSIFFMHHHHFFHRDIKPNNILIDENRHPRLTGFTFTLPFTDDQVFNETVGTTLYLAPEIINGDDYNYKIDIYSFSMVMYEILTGKKPIDEHNMNQYAIMRSVLEGVRPTFNGFNVKPSFEALIQRCWSADPDERPTAQELYEKFSSDPDYFLDDIDEDKFNEYIRSIN